MNKLLSFSLVALMAGAAAAADAAPRDDDRRGDRGRNGHYQGGHHAGQYERHDGYYRGARHDYRHDRRHDRRDHRYSYRQDKRHWGHNGYRPRGYYHPGHYRAPVRYVRPHGYRYHRWAAGHYLPRSYYGPSYYVDYRPYRLAPPPYGHHWVRVDNDVFLVALTTGLIAHAVHDLFH